MRALLGSWHLAINLAIGASSFPRRRLSTTYHYIHYPACSIRGIPSERVQRSRLVDEQREREKGASAGGEG